MLEKLVVDNYLLIDHIEFDAYENMSVFVGETGSGKSLFIESLGIILGNKFSLANIGTFRDITMMSAIFSVSEKMSEVQHWFKQNDFSLHDEIIITRTFQKSGKSITRLNGEVVPVQLVRQIGDLLVDIHSQFDTQQLLKNTVQHESIDAHIQVASLDAYKEAFLVYKQRTEDYNRFLEEQQKLHDLDYLHFQREELEPFQEYTLEKVQALEQHYKYLKIAVQNRQYVERCISLLSDDGLRQFLPELKTNLLHIGNDEIAPALLSSYEQLVANVDEIDYVLNQQYQDEESFAEFEQLEHLLQNIYRLQQKHSENLAEAYATVTEQIERIEEAETFEVKLQASMKEAESKARMLALKLDEQRDTVIEQVEMKMRSYFKKLHLENIQFRVFREVHDDLTRTGLSTIQFQVASNNQKTFQPLAKVVSGGELSRIMLALKVVMLGKQQMLMVFDEIDSGVSGKVAASIADVLYELAKLHQVFLITHSPLVAVSGKHFYQISKHIRNDGQYETNITVVQKDEINYMLAHLISQQIPSQSAIEQIQHLRTKYQ